MCGAGLVREPRVDAAGSACNGLLPCKGSHEKGADSGGTDRGNGGRRLPGVVVLGALPSVSAKRRIVQNVESERTVRGGLEIHLTYRTSDEHPVPAILMLPESTVPSPGAVLVHGYSSKKEHVADPVGKALLEHGIASLALDLPLHGTRADPVQRQSMRDPLGVVRLWRQALADVRLGLRYLGARREVDGGALALLGYSMGSFLSVAIAADDPAVRALVLAAGGDLPEGTPFARIARTVADPVRAIRKLGGRPLLMVHGRRDTTVTPAQANRLFEAAQEPKEMIWFDAGHYLPPAASETVAQWLRARLSTARAYGD
jgi:uncharacterized protein